MQLPEEDKQYATKGMMLNDIKHLLGGRVAELLRLDDISTGASNDIQRATDVARAMVTKYGFSDRHCSLLRHLMDSSLSSYTQEKSLLKISKTM